MSKKRDRQAPILEPGEPPKAQSMLHVERRAPDPNSAPVIIVHREPLVERAEWKDPADTGTAARMHGARSVQGWRRVWVIQTLHAGSPREITAAHVKAAEKLLGDYEVGIEGASQGGGSMDRVDGASNDGLNPWSARLKAAARYRAAMEALGSQAGLIVSLMVVDNWSVVRLAESLGIGRDRAFGRLQAGLERLREYYSPPRENTAVRAATEASGGAVDPTVSDVSQERLGRWRTLQASGRND